MSSRSSRSAHPIYTGRTSYLSLKLHKRILAILGWSSGVLIFGALVVAMIVGILNDESGIHWFSDLLGSIFEGIESDRIGRLIYVIFIFATAIFFVCLAVDTMQFNALVKFVSSIHYDPNLVGSREKKSSRMVKGNMDHSKVKFIIFKVYKDKLVVNDYSGLHEWVYLLKGTYHIRVRQSFWGKAFNFGDVYLASAGLGGRNITFRGIKNPHGFKNCLEANMQPERMHVGVMIPH